MEPEQLSLFSDQTIKPSYRRRELQLEMSREALIEWKSRIYEHQQRSREAQQLQQSALFEVAPNHCDPEQIDPLTLQLDTLSFFERPNQGRGDACIYFVVDTAAGLVLYVGETIASNQRWKGTHDAKSYAHQYIMLHRKYKLEVAVCMSFWWDAPTNARARQALERKLILKWRSPLNKENWEMWGQPFQKR